MRNGVWCDEGRGEATGKRIRRSEVPDGFSYDSALIGVSHDDRAIYDYDLMVEWLMEDQGFTEEEAVEWIDYNTIRALPYMGADGPIVLYRFWEE